MREWISKSLFCSPPWLRPERKPRTYLECTTGAHTVGARSAGRASFALAIAGAHAGARLVAVAAAGCVLEAHHGCLLLEAAEQRPAKDSLGVTGARGHGQQNAGHQPEDSSAWIGHDSCVCVCVCVFVCLFVQFLLPDLLLFQANFFVERKKGIT